MNFALLFEMLLLSVKTSIKMNAKQDFNLQEAYYPAH